METAVGGQRDKDGKEWTVVFQENIVDFLSRKLEMSPEPEPIPGGPCIGHCCQFLPQRIWY